MSQNPNARKFSCAVAMLIHSEDQFQVDMLDELDGMGYHIETKNFVEFPILTNRPLWNENFEIVNTEKTISDCIFIDRYDPEFFLALAAVSEDQNELLIGQLVLDSASGDYGVIENWSNYEGEGEKFGIVNQFGIVWIVPKENIRRATVEEIIVHYNETYPGNHSKSEPVDILSLIDNHLQEANTDDAERMKRIDEIIDFLMYNKRLTALSPEEKLAFVQTMEPELSDEERKVINGCKTKKDKEHYIDMWARSTYFRRCAWMAYLHGESTDKPFTTLLKDKFWIAEYTDGSKLVGDFFEVSEQFFWTLLSQMVAGTCAHTSHYQKDFAEAKDALLKTKGFPIRFNPFMFKIE